MATVARPVAIDPSEDGPIAATPASRVDPPAPIEERFYRFSPDQVDRMTRSGILQEGAPIVLLDGMLVRKLTKGERHVAATYLALEALTKVLPPGFWVRKEDPILLPDGPSGFASEPEPDLAIIRGSIRDYLHRRPTPADVLFVVEVADSTLRDDRLGLPRLAWANVALAWIANLVSDVIEVYSDPTGPGPDPRFASCRTFRAGEAVPVVIDGTEVGRILVSDILPP